MPRYTVEKVYAFSSPDGGGNPAGVMLLGDGALSEEQMQGIARAVGFSETAFVSRSKVADYRIDFFTPTKRIPNCGHATVAAFSLLKRQNPELSHTSQETVAGVRSIFVGVEGVFLEQPLVAPALLERLDALSSELFEQPIGLQSAWIARHDVGFLLIEVTDEAALSRLTPRFEAIRAYSEANDLVGIYLFVRQPGGPTQATTRMFAPAYGIDEESATGMAASLLASLLYEQSGAESLVIEQGRHMTPASPSLIQCRVERDRRTVLVGGTARFHAHEAVTVEI